MKKKAIFCWSGGKDSALALHRVQQKKDYQVEYLLCTLNAEHKRISMHGIREELLDQQAKALGIPLLKMWVHEATNAHYEEQMRLTLEQCKSEGIDHVIFGDIFLEDLRAYREEKLQQVGMRAVFPLWKIPTQELIHEFIDSNFQSVICCVNSRYLTDDFAGRFINKEFVNDLPQQVDVCGENGEYHSFCFAGPIFHSEISFTIGERKIEELELKPDTFRFCFLELVPTKISDTER